MTETTPTLRSPAALARMTQRALTAEAEVRRLRLGLIGVRVWTNEDGRRFVFAEDLIGLLDGEAD